MNQRHRLSPLVTLLAVGAGGAALAAVFLAYLDPHLMADLANRVWACF
jgi:hypothetical protein